VHSEALVIKKKYDTIDYIVTTFYDFLLNSCLLRADIRALNVLAATV